MGRDERIGQRLNEYYAEDARAEVPEFGFASGAFADELAETDCEGDDGKRSRAWTVLSELVKAR